MYSKNEWGKNDVDTLLKMYPNHTAKEIADCLGIIEKRVNRKVHLLKKKGIVFEKSEWYKKVKVKEFAQNSEKSIATRFKKGIVPHNTGKKGSFMVGGNKTSFKKGNKPHNTQEIGTIVDWCGGKGKYNYLKIKVGEANKWELLHRWVWIQTFGEIPDGYLVKFKDGNYTNCKPENLYLQNKQGNMLQNSIHNYPNEIKEVMYALKKLDKQIKNKK